MSPNPKPVETDWERDAIERARRGDPAALEPVLAAHAEALFSSVILPRTGERATAEDILRDTFATAIEKIHGFRWEGRSLFFWLRQIAMNRVIDHHRKNGRSRRILDAFAEELALAPPEARADDTLIAEADRRRARERIETAMRALPERYAQAIRLRIVEEQPRDACAAALQVTVGNFDVILFRAVRAFRKAYGERDE